MGVSRVGDGEYNRRESGSTQPSLDREYDSIVKIETMRLP
jgi:hypothetical protein